MRVYASELPGTSRVLGQDGRQHSTLCKSARTHDTAPFRGAVRTIQSWSPVSSLPSQAAVRSDEGPLRGYLRVCQAWVTALPLPDP